MKTGPDFRGGLTRYEKVKRELSKLLRDRNVVVVTTMYDLYGLPRDFPGYDQGLSLQPYDKITCLEARFAEDVGDRRFRPYIQLHEFETFLFVAPDVTAQVLGLNSRQCDAVNRITSSFASPEEIDDGPNTAPSKRITEVCEGYDKTFDGPQVTSRVGLDRLRRACPHFGAWLDWLEGV